MFVFSVQPQDRFIYIFVTVCVSIITDVVALCFPDFYPECIISMLLGKSVKPIKYVAISFSCN